jgi:hypothetical protein
MKAFLDSYEQGYFAGLRLATSLPGERAARQGTDTTLDGQSDIASRPAYRHGFADGIRDGVEAMAHRRSMFEVIVKNYQ